MSDKNFAVFNSLNLINKKLGKSYEKNGFNPFSDKYVLTAESVEKLLKMNLEKKFVKAPEFLEESEEALAERFKLAKVRAEELLEKFQAILNSGNASPKMLEELVYLKICTELLRGVDLKNLNYEELLELIQTMYALSVEYAVVFRRVFDKDFDVQVALTEFIKLCKITKTKKEIQKQQDLKSLVHRQFTEKTFFEKPKQSKSKEKEMEK